MGKHPEKILVVPAVWVQELVPEGFSTAVGALTELLRPDIATLQVRDEVEHTPAWKQVIPYVAFMSIIPINVFTYTRAKAGGEERLHDLLSLGVGGHIEEKDLDGHAAIGYSGYMAALRRELVEEIEVVSSNPGQPDLVTPYDGSQTAMTPCGLINDNSNGVGRCHLGVFHLVGLQGQHIRAREDHLADVRWLNIQMLVDACPRFETWSQLVIRDFLLPDRVKG